MKPELFVRADGNPNIGTGHLVRCISLAHMLKAEFEITFYCKECPESFEEELMEHVFGLIKIRNEEQFFDELDSNTIAVLDGYNFDTAYQRKVKDKGCKLVCIDDLHNKEFLADLIINHAPGVSENDYKTPSYTIFALGPEYALLRPAFLDQAKKQRLIIKVETVMICFGGSDPRDLTQYVLKVILEFEEFKKIIVITGSEFNPSGEFKLLIKSDKRIDYRFSLNEKQMLTTMLEAELAIVPASGIIFEVLAAGCLVVSGYYIDNQLAIYNGFKAINSIIDIGQFSELKKELRKVDLTKVWNIVKPIDGKSNIRIMEKFMYLLC
jgi:UDP-2,4-diacetamido-2,4,6-trideoxy-beta-L-altropyranose hydrolase